MKTKLTEAVMRREIAKATAWRTNDTGAKPSAYFLWDSDCSGLGAKFYATGRAVCSSSKHLGLFGLIS